MPANTTAPAPRPKTPRKAPEKAPVRIDTEKLDAYVEKQMSRFKWPALELAVVADGNVVLATGYGKRDVERDLPATAKTLFCHGSAAKSMTAFLAALLVQDGLLEWDRPVREYLPEFRLFDLVATERVTLRDLLTHRTGLPRHEMSWMTRPSISREALLNSLRFLEPSKDIRQTFQYCNLGYAAAGYLIGRVTGSTYEEQMRQRVFAPLRMERAQASLPEVRSTEDRGVGYSEKDGKVFPVEYREFDATCPAGGIFVCAEDSVRWLLLQTSGGELDGKRVLAEAAFNELHSVQIPMGLPGAADADVSMSGYAFGWMVGEYRGHRMVTHGGGIDGFSTDVIMLPDQRLGVAVCSNRLGAPPTPVARHVLDLLIGAEEKDWAGDMYTVMQQAKAASAKRKPRRNRPAGGRRPAHPLPDYAAEYEHPGYGTLTVSGSDKDLFVRLNEVDMTAIHRGYESWDLEYPGFESLPLNVTFFTDAYGRVSEVYGALEDAVEPIRFKRRAEAELSDPDFLAKLAGKYSLGPASIEVRVSATGGLVATAPGAGELKLVAAGELAFTIPAQGGLRVEFIVNGDGLARELKTPMGVLTREAGASGVSGVKAAHRQRRRSR